MTDNGKRNRGGGKMEQKDELRETLVWPSVCPGVSMESLCG